MRRDQDSTIQSSRDEAPTGLGRLVARGRLSRRRSAAVALVSIATGLAIGAVHVASAIAPSLPEPPVRKTALLSDAELKAGLSASNGVPSDAYRILNPAVETAQADLSGETQARWDTGRIADDTREGDLAPDIVQTPASAGQTGRKAAPKTYKTVCVRLCDGFFIPISFATTTDRIKRDVAACQRRCGSGARLFLQENPARGTAKLRDLGGNVYRNLPNAFLFRTHYRAGCTCRSGPAQGEELAQPSSKRQPRSARLHLEATQPSGVGAAKAKATDSGNGVPAAR